MANPWYITRERFKRSLDNKPTARNDQQVDDLIEAASRTAEGKLGRRFYPRVATYSFPAPRGDRLFIGWQVEADLVAATSITVDGTAIDTADYTLAPVDGPPYSTVEFDSAPGRYLAGRPVAIAGTWGYDNRTRTAGTLAAAVATTTATTVDVTDSAAVGVGDLLTVDTEKMLVTAKSMLTTGQTMQGALGGSTAETAFAVTNGAAYTVGEVLLVDSERLLLVDIAGNTLIVKRAWDGTVLASHSGATVYALRRLTVERGVLGTTAATHLIAAALVAQVYPGPLVELVTVLAQDAYLREVTGQQHEAGAQGGDKTVIDQAIARAVVAVGRESGFA